MRIKEFLRIFKCSRFMILPCKYTAFLNILFFWVLRLIWSTRNVLVCVPYFFLYFFFSVGENNVRIGRRIWWALGGISANTFFFHGLGSLFSRLQSDQRLIESTHKFADNSKHARTVFNFFNRSMRTLEGVISYRHNHLLSSSMAC